VTRLQFTSRILKPVVWLAALGPAAWIALAAFGLLGLDLGADPVKTLQVTTGLACIILLLATLTITPARKLTHFSELIRLRRLLGLFAFFYALLHALIYFVFDQSLSLKLIWEDTIEHPRIAVGFVAFLLLIPLALTSTNASIRRLGKRWTRLHRLIYLATGLGILHYLMVQKLDIRVGLVYVASFALLMIARTLISKGAGNTR
jgi:methionine sulfoxide reductase heme-binding subunit